MKRIMFALSFTVFTVAFLLGQSLATKPGNTENPNGFPSGAHYNLNIISKQDTFQCPEQQYYWQITGLPVGYIGTHDVGEKVQTCPEGFVCALTNIPIYGNVIFVPQYGENNQIYMQSGSGKGTKTATITELQVIDPCTSFYGADSAILQLPPNANGYDVYARALATPTDNPSMKTTPSLDAVMDENGDALVLLGWVSSTGFTKPDGETFTRGKGQSTALKITSLFEWSGTVIYQSYEVCADYGCSQICCSDTNVDGVYDVCVNPFEGACGDGFTPLWGVTYTDEWVFNIADFVSYLWDVDNNGLKLLQVRFYPR